MGKVICAVDVGTRSARAAIFDLRGQMGPREVVEFGAGNGGAEGYRTSDIWTAVCAATRGALTASGVDTSEVEALAFDATCSLVLTGKDGAPLALTETGHDIIAWYDRRAEVEAGICTAAGGAVIDQLGGAMSPEMQAPKLLWLKTHRPEAWARLGRAQDLADYLVSRSVGLTVASVGTLGTKWPYLPQAGGWQDAFLAAIGLDDLRDHAGLPDTALPIGASAGSLTRAAAADLGLAPGTCVAAGLIDGYAGALGCQTMLAGATALVAGTSASVLAPSDGTACKDLWGPFAEVLRPGTFAVEGGLAEAGSLLDRVLAQGRAGQRAKLSHNAILAEIDTLLAQGGLRFADDLHVLIDRNGQRGPRSDPRIGGMVEGLRDEAGLAASAALYWRSAVALALEVDVILCRLDAAGLGSSMITATGGVLRSPRIGQLIADATGRSLVIPDTIDGVLLGTAMAGAVAAGLVPDFETAFDQMAPVTREITPDPAAKPQYDRDRAVRAAMIKRREANAGQ